MAPASPACCAARLERANILHAGPEAADCAKRLGPRRAFYTSRDTADDVEALRKRLGVKKVSLYGVSYGTLTALSYALRYPDRVDRLVLDSVLEPEGVDALYRRSIGAVPRVLGSLCRNACDSFTDDPVDDLRALVARMGGGVLRGIRVDANGRRRPASIRSFDLLLALISGDFDTYLRAVFPSAVRAATEGDLTPLLRLKHRAIALEGGPYDPRALSSALYAATSCEEARLPWDRGAPFADRARQAQAAVAALPESDFAPFDRSTALESDFLELCGRWREARTAPAPGPGPLPDVPTLIINGANDLRTPVKSARAVAALLPRSRLLVIPGVGHSLYGRSHGLRRSCVHGVPERGRRPSAAAGLAGPRRNRWPRGGCATWRPRKELPASAAGSGCRGPDPRRRGPVDIFDSYTDAALAEGGGLRGGSYSLSFDTAAPVRGTVYVPGVRVFGKVAHFGRDRRRGTLRVDGPPGADGVLRLRGRRFSGRVAGRRVGGTLALNTPDSSQAVVARRYPVPPR